MRNGGLDHLTGTISLSIGKEGARLSYATDAACPMLTGISFTSGSMCMCEPKQLAAWRPIVDIARRFIRVGQCRRLPRIAGQILKCATVMYSSNVYGRP